MNTNRIWNVWTDGSCDPNPGKGGWAFYAKSQNSEFFFMGGDVDTTNNRMEYTAAIEALKYLPEGDPVVIHSDSMLLINTMTKWAARWIKKNELHKKKNPDLIETLISLDSQRSVQWQWVRGHSGVFENEVADTLANEACRSPFEFQWMRASEKPTVLDCSR